MTSGYAQGRPPGTLPTPKGNAAPCACGCGHRTSTARTEYIMGHRPPKTVRDKVDERSAANESGCVEWSGSMFSNGYGRLLHGGRALLAHRAAYEAFVGPIPEGLTVDHLCRNRKCVNTSHMELVTRGENARRGGGLSVAMANYRARTHCVNGHEYTPENTLVRKNGTRACRECGRRAARDCWRRKNGWKP